MFRRAALLSLFFINFCLAQQLTPSAQQLTPAKIRDLKPTVLLISIDGFRWDYLKQMPSPNLHRLMREGVVADALIPSFPTKTFPNHYTIVTGLYPEHHGMIANNFWDPATQKKFSMDNRELVRDGHFWGGEPIWVTAQLQGQKTAPMFWPGSEADVKGVRPNHVLPYDENFGHERRLEQFLKWLDQPQADRPTFFTLYFEDVDSAGHDFGPGSPELIRAVEKVDRTIGKLLAALEQRGVADKINIVVVSDHGMVKVDPANQIFLEDYIDVASVRISDWSPVLMLSAGNDTEATIAKLRKAPHLKVYRKGELPARLHFAASERIPEIIALADPGWMVTTRKRLAERKKPQHGEHGYDNADKDTWGIFIARGPAFRSGKRIRPFANIHIYSALCSILGLQPAPNDGSLLVLAPVLNAPAARPQQTAPRTSAPRTAPAEDRRSQTVAQSPLAARSVCVRICRSMR
jgi:predicted AlkP superfamily pyrophosphatase or phosphodiesterase